ncbi:MAG: ATP-binding protein [Anaerolineaceae bacterium]|nr:ATP-binding protein [Anaerolineaceae bacterium]
MMSFSEELPSPSDPRLSNSDFQEGEPSEVKVGSLKELIDIVTGRSVSKNLVEEEFGTFELLPFPFLALTGQAEMKLALLLALANPSIGGVLLIGPRGTGKTTAVRSLLDLLPNTEHSNCFYGCMPEDIESGGIGAVCPDCAKKYGEGKPLTRMERAALVELPLHSTLDDVIGSLDERAVLNKQIRIRRGLLAQAHKNILFADEVNLLSRDIINAILDAAAAGSYSVRRGSVSVSYQAHFTLIGSMNPEEGALRPQIMDRFGLKAIVRGLENSEERQRAWQSTQAYAANPRQFVQQYHEETRQICAEIQEIRRQIHNIHIPDEILQAGINLIQHLKIDSLRAEISLFEASRAYTAMDGRKTVELGDLQVVAPLALRLRRSVFMEKYFADQAKEDLAIKDTLDSISALVEPKE